MSEFVAVFRGKVGASVGVLEPTLAELELPVGGSLSDLLSADSILVIGADPLSDHQVLGFHIKRARMKGARLILVADEENEMTRFADKKFRRNDLDKAIKLCQNSAFPVVVYGQGTSQKEAQRLVELKRKAHFIPLFPATNGYHAKVLGLQCCMDIDHTEVAYLLLSEAKIPEDLAQQARKAKFLVVHASYRDPITDMADVVLPALVWYENEGSLYNVEGKKVPVRKAVPYPEGLIPENEVLTQLAARL
jgi:formate dehydrogenase major subunit